MNSNALTRIQAMVLITIVVVAGVVGVVGYVFLGSQNQSAETIKIGLCADIDNRGGERMLQGITLAVEQVNAEGGVLGRNFEIIVEDDDSETPPSDIVVATNALTRLITVDKVDFILTSGTSGQFAITFQDICADHNIIHFSMDMLDNSTQRVADNYERYKGYFRVGAGNLTSALMRFSSSLLTLRDYSGFNKVAYLAHDANWVMASGAANFLREEGFDVVYEVTFPPGTVDFSSYFAAVEASGAEILVPFVQGAGASHVFPLIKEYYDRQSPVVAWGVFSLIGDADAWELTEGKCEFVSFVGFPVVSGYPLTNKTIPTREAFIERLGALASITTTRAYDLVRFILPDAIERAGSIEYEAMIKALEETDVETSCARHWMFTSGHDVMMGEDPNDPDTGMLAMVFQWQDEVQVPVNPKWVMEDVGATYKFPDWPGPWDQ